MSVGSEQQAVPTASGDDAALQKRTAYFEVAMDKQGQWHWCLWTANGRAMALNADGYNERNDCTRAIETLQEIMKQPLQIVVAHK